MAVSIEIQRSEGGLGDAAFAAVATIPDPSPTPWQYEDDSVQPGRLYIYRARRVDGETGLSSPWSDVTPASIARALFPNCEVAAMTMIDTCDVLTGSDEALYWGLEPFEGIPVKPEWMLPMVDAQVSRQHQRRYSNRKRGAHTLRRFVRAGRAVYEADFDIEVTPEAFAHLLLTALAHSSEVPSGVTRTRHSFKNAKTCHSGTFIHKVGDIYYVLAGCKIGSIAIEPDLEGDSVLTASLTVMATALWVLKKADIPTVEIKLGLASAAEDLLDNYTPEDAAVYLAEEIGEVRTCSFNFARDMARYKVYDGTRGAKGHYSKSGDPSASMSAYFGNDPSLRRLWEDFGHEADPAAGFGLGDEVITVPARTLFTPPENGDGFVNELEVLYPAADISANESSSGRNEVVQNMTLVAIDEAGNGEGTDFVLKLTNSITGADLVTPNALIAPADVPLTRAFTLAYGQATGAPTTTSVVAGNAATNPHLVRTDDVYNGRKMRFVTGALAGEERAITDYVATTGTFTVAAFGSAPAAGDVFVIL